jgi:hypothetical protein
MNEPAGRRVPTVHELAAAALAILARNGAPAPGGVGATWLVPDGLPFEISCIGPDLPDAIEPAIATAERILNEWPWTGIYRLIVRASRLIVLDLYWNPGAPTRIMGFSRGDWEHSLLATAPA